MLKRIYPIIYLSSLVIAFSGCSAGYTILEEKGAKQVYVSDSKAKVLINIASESNNHHRLYLLNQRFSTNGSDPVVQNFYGAVLMVNGDYDQAATRFKHSLQTLLRDGHFYYSKKQNLKSRLNTPKQEFSETQVRIQENQAILNGLAVYFQRNKRAPLFISLKNRSGHIPDPPIYQTGGLIGLALESIAESLQHTDFHPKIVTYKTDSFTSLDTDRISINRVSQNLLTSCILAKNKECLYSAISMVKRYPKSQWTLALENHIAIALYLLDDNSFREHLNLSNRRLFSTQNRDQTVTR